MADEEIPAWAVHILADLHDIAKMVTEMHAELEEFRPLLAVFKPGNGTSDLAKAGLIRGLRKAAKSGN